MVNKKGKGSKPTNHREKDVQKNPEIVTQKKNISDSFLDELKGAFTNFDKLEESKRTELYGNKEYLEQFWEYFKKNHPNLLDKIEKKDLPVYIQALEDKGFSVANIKKNTGKLHEEFKDENTELQVMNSSLSDLKKFCADSTNNIPVDVFKKFADAAGFNHSTLEISPDGKIAILDDLPLVWKKFLEKEGIVLGETSAAQAERILTPNYNPTERVMITVALTKIKRELKGSLRAAFEVEFPLPITVHSTCQDLLAFKDALSFFLTTHASEIDESLAKKIDSVIVTNGDIYKELSKSGRKFDDTKGFSEREQYFRRIFNKLATRQLFEEVQKTQETIDHYVTVMGDTFKQFPPYLNDILQMEEYRFNAKHISAVDPSFDADMHDIEDQIVDLDVQFKSAPTNEKKNELREKIKALRLQKEQRKWQAYIAFLRTKNAPLAEVFAQLVGSKFDFSVLSPDHQQLLIDVLIKNKLEDTIKNKVPELLSVKEEELTQFVHDLFDLKKMDLTIPTRHGPVPLTFLKKEFLTSIHKQLPAIGDLEDLKNIPLNFVTQLTDSNAAFFEDSEIFRSLYTDFAAKNGKFRFNDGYKVRIKKNGKVVEGYLSSYSPIDERNTDKESDGKELYLYSQPISAPDQTRELVTRPNEEGKIAIPVVIKDAEQAACEMEILDKQINLNGDAFGALLFGYVLGQQSMNTTMSPQKEDELAKKLGSLEVYKDKAEEENEPEPIVETPEKTNEATEKEKFTTERKNLKGYAFSEEKYAKNAGFVEGSRLFMPFADSEVPPVKTGKAWLQAEIIHIDEAKGTFKIKFHGGELGLGKSEGATKELPINTSSLAGLKKAFGDTLYKVPDMKGMSFDQQMDKITTGAVAKDLDKNFGSVKCEGSKFSYTLGEYKGKEITHFGIYEPKAIGESLDEESGRLMLYKIKPNSNGTINVSGDSTNGNYAKNFPARDMDYVTFMLFVKEKGLQPKCKEQTQAISAKVKEDTEVATTSRGFSINNIMSFFTNGVNKIKDGMKKYDDERSEDLTDILTSNGKLWGTIGGFLSPFSRISSSFENMGMEQYLERDNRIWKKVEKWTKFYEDFDYSKLYTEVINPMLTGKAKIVPHYKIAAILLVHLKKGKGPYAKNLPVVDGKRIGMLLGADHQERYRVIREKKIRELEENAHVYGGPWADQIKNELVELEMRYIVHVMDGRHMGMGDDEKYKFQNKYSKKFCDELEGAYTGFYKQSTVEEGFTKNQDVNFEFARVEYFRQLADRPQQALPFLKVMATKAINAQQWQVFETAVLVGMLSGVFLNMTYASTQKYIQKICRTRGFIPGIFAKDIKHQSKIQRLLDLYSGDKFTSATGYNPANCSYRKNEGVPGTIAKLVDSKGNGWMEDPSRMKDLSEFLSLTGKNVNNKTLLDLYADPKTSESDKLLLKEYIDKSNEKNEELDSDVQQNTSSLTGSILTKSQSVVEQMIKIDQYGFAGKDGDAKQNMESFSKEMQKAIPTEKQDSESKVKFFVEKFFNRFNAFSGTKKTEFLKRLVRCSQHPGSPDIENILYYSVVGEIIGSVASHDAHMPEELEGALNAWKEFFKSNLNTILRPSVIAATFGNQYKTDVEKLSKDKPELYSWEDASLLLDKQDSNMYIATLPGNEEKAQARLKKQELKRPNGKYINGSLYELAEQLTKKCSGFQNNRFKTASDHKKSLHVSSTKATGEETYTSYIPENIYDDDYDT
ncbi:MAG: hypothetical protein NT085_01880 [candidate division SR1 bacterium]|nr:hypothetical protein [candidate division SR1 bacterium]